MANVEAMQGSEEIFNTDPLPPCTNSADSESRSVAFISQERLSATQQTDEEEVSYNVLLPNVLFKLILSIFDCCTIILQRLCMWATEKIVIPL